MLSILKPFRWAERNSPTGCPSRPNPATRPTSTRMTLQSKLYRTCSIKPCLDPHLSPLRHWLKTLRTTADHSYFSLWQICELPTTSASCREWMLSCGIASDQRGRAVPVLSNLACLQVCVCIYIYMFVYTYTHTYIHTYIHTSMHTYIPFHSIPFHSIPFHSIPFHSIPFHSIHAYIHTYIHYVHPCIHTFHSIPFHYITLH